METVKYKHSDLRLFEIITKYRFPHDEWERITDVTTEWSWRCFGFVYAVSFRKRETPLSQITAKYLIKSITEGRTVYVPDIEVIHKLYAMIDPLKLKVSNKGNYFEIKLLGILVVLFISSISSYAQRKPIYTSLEASYIVLQIEDIHLTHKAINAGAVELNPAARWMIDNRMLIPCKLISTTAFLYTCRVIHRENPKLATLYLVAGNAIYSAVVFNNYQVTLRMKI